MNYRKLGRSGLKVSTLCLGTNVFGWTSDEPTSFAVLDAYLAGGGNFLDTANTYNRWVPGHSGGESETVIGNWLTARGNRHNVILATKAAGGMGGGPNDKGLSRVHLRQQIENSLRRLRTDYIDLYQTHYDDADTPVEEFVRTLDDLVREGKVRYLGASNVSAWRLMKALGVADRLNKERYVCVQPLYNLIEREQYEREMEPLCLEEGIAVIPYSSLASGFLSGKYRTGQPLPSSGRAQGVERRYMNARGFGVLAAVEEVAKAGNWTPAQVAIAWLAQRPSVTAPIASATTVDQLSEIMAAADIVLSADAVARLDGA